MSHLLREKAKEFLAEEVYLFSQEKKATPYLVALAYPNTYNIGMSNLGFQNIYYLLNQENKIKCERFFSPSKDEEEEYRRTNTPLFSLESQTFLEHFDVLAFSLSFELDYLNILQIMELGKIPFLRAERKEEHPLVIAGGPCAFFNPEPLAEIIDLFIVGEGEEVLVETLRKYFQAQEEGKKREDILKDLAQIPGVYVPRFYQPIYQEEGILKEVRKLAQDVPDRIERRWVRELDDYLTASHILTPYTQFGDMYLLEISRGCGRHCRFCMAGFCYRPPRRRSLEKVWEMIEKGLVYRDKLGLVGAAISDYEYIDQLCERLKERKVRLSVSSLRVDSLSRSLLEALVESENKTITIAPEAGSERLRKVINKGVSEEDIEQALVMFNQYGINQIKLYFIIGLPTETKEDLEAIVRLAVKIRENLKNKGGRRVILGVTPFVPKPFTPFQWEPMEALKAVEEKIKYLQKAIGKEKNLELNFESPRWSVIQGLLARGDRRLGAVLVDAYQGKGNYQSWLKALKKNGLDVDFYLYRQRSKDELLPWDFLEPALEREYLWQEREKAYQEIFSFPCQPGTCQRCGICKGEKENV